VPSVLASDARTFSGQHLAAKKGSPSADPEPPPVLATLAQTHTGERVLLDATSPPQERFDALLADRATGQRAALDPRLLGLLRDLAGAHPGCRIELVSGYRSQKLNEMLRKKGHHVASHSQHSLGNAVDFRIIPLEADGHWADKALSPLVVEKEIRARGWVGGVGTYPKPDDWFVHADVGPNRRWDGQ
jgi:uncharacterized protein YcbK (DUF882 family)